jgi:hypothetical protein
MAKKVFYDAEAREKILGGAKALYDAVKVTFGPKGRNVVIEKSYVAPTITPAFFQSEERKYTPPSTGEFRWYFKKTPCPDMKICSPPDILSSISAGTSATSALVITGPSTFTESQTPPGL